MKIKTGQKWLDLFYEFISYLTISSKELDAAEPVPLMNVLYNAQYRFLREVCDGLDQGIHSFVCLKARQLGISTISLACDVFWLSVHDRMQGALITDTEANKEKFRILLEHYMLSLPDALRVKIVKHNRNNLVLENGSILDYLVAGTKKKAMSRLATSRALNFVHATELSSWGSTDGFDSLKASLAQKHPDRLYIWESTARGYGNLFWNVWSSAKEDAIRQHAFFIGWWAKEDYQFAQGSREFKEYWTGSYDVAEQQLIDEVKERYGFAIKPEQIAWHRYMRTVEKPDEDVMNQEYPWTEDQAFILTGKSFFSMKRVNEDMKFLITAQAPLKSYRYTMGENFLATQIEETDTTSDADLRVWEEPVPHGVYVMGIDPAYGRSDSNDRHSIQLYRCYADKLVQVAEYATSEPESYQVAWVMSHLAGVYKNVWLNLEINGPGAAVQTELRHLKQLMSIGYLQQAAGDRGLADVFSAVKWYLYHRPDSLGVGFCYNWKTTADNKMVIFNQLRDAYALRQLVVRSIPMLDEMRGVTQDGDEISHGANGYDDRVFASCLACKAWVDWVRGGMIADNQTYAIVTEQERQRHEEPQTSFMGYMVSDFFKRREEQRSEIDDFRSWAGSDLDD